MHLKTIHIQIEQNYPYCHTSIFSFIPFQLHVNNHPLFSLNLGCHLDNRKTLPSLNVHFPQHSFLIGHIPWLTFSYYCQKSACIPDFKRYTHKCTHRRIHFVHIGQVHRCFAVNPSLILKICYRYFFDPELVERNSKLLQTACSSSPEESIYST